MRPVIRMATPADVGPILEVYGPIVAETAISFENEVPAADAMCGRIAETTAALPWLVPECDGRIDGYAYAAPHRARAAYAWSVDVSIYLRASARGRGIGRGLYRALFRVLRRLGYWNAYAGITLPNPASVALHESLGFEPVGIYRGVGYKFGVWHDVGHWHLALGERPARPAPPLLLSTAAGSAALREALGDDAIPARPRSDAECAT